MTSTDRPVSLDLGMSSNPNFDAKPESGLGNRPDLNSRAQPQPDPQQQEKDALKLRELLVPERDTPPLPPPPASPQEPSATQLQPIGLFGQGAMAEAVASTTIEVESPVSTGIEERPEKPEASAHMAEEVTQSAGGHREVGDSGTDQLQKTADTLKLRELLESEEVAHHQLPPQAQEQSVANLRPFDLFGNSTPAGAPAAPATAAESPAMAELEASLVHMSRRLLVGESAHGSVVRLELAAEHLPGVVVEVYKDQGAIVAQFICADEHSRTRLVRAVPWLSASLSSKLDQNTLVRVMTDDPEDPCPVETRHQAVSG